MLNFRLARPSALVDLAEIDGLAGIRVEDGALVVGAMTRQWDLEHSSDAFPLLREALAPRRPHGDALPWNGRRLARPRRPDRRAAGVRPGARSGAASRPAARFRRRSSSSRSSRPRSSRTSCSSRCASRARRADVVPGDRTATATSPSSASRAPATGSPSAGSRRRPCSGTAGARSRGRPVRARPATSATSRGH